VSAAASAEGNAATAGVDTVTDAASDAVTAITSTRLFATAKGWVAEVATGPKRDQILTTLDAKPGHQSEVQ
jgi:hypothetical protein